MARRRMTLLKTGILTLGIGAIVTWSSTVAAAVIAAAFSGSYAVTNLGSVVGNGGLAFLPGDPNHILLGHDANAVTGVFYKVPVTRDANCHVNGFLPHTTFGTVGEYNDGGVTNWRRRVSRAAMKIESTTSTCITSSRRYPSAAPRSSPPDSPAQGSSS